MEDVGEKRRVTSAIDGMSVREVRWYLGRVRSQWQNANTEPFFLTNTFNDGKVSVQDFAVKFVVGQHLKRHRKSGPTSSKNMGDNK